MLGFDLMAHLFHRMNERFKGFPTSNEERNEKQ